MDSIRKVYEYAEPNLTLVGWMGFIGFPLYYFVWDFMFPQSYENLPLRLFCSALFFGIIFRNRLSSSWRKYVHVYYQITITTCLPFFFFYMLLMNDWSNVWVMSFMSAIFLHILLVHVTRVMFAQTFAGIGLATFFAWIAKGFHLDITMDWTHVPIFLFIYVFGNMFYFRNQVEHEAKVSLAKSFGAGIAHEMRNPLSGLCTSIDVIQSVLPNKKAIGEKDQYVMSGEDVTLLREVSEDAMNIIHSGNETIDLLLTSIDENRVSRSSFKRYSAQSVVEKAIESFSYKRSTDRFAISFDARSEFDFLGSDTLLKYVMYNLFKNAFHHRSSDEFHIHVSMQSNDTANQIVVTDNGSGIAPDVIRHIFQDFYTTGKSGSYGLGLPFCKKVMRSFGGNIKCISQPGEWSQFTLTFPPITSDTVTEIKDELTKMKSILLVSNQDIIVQKMADISRFMGFDVTVLDVKSVFKKKEYEFEFDLIFVDVESLDVLENQLDRIESLLSFTEARVVYLFEHKPAQRAKKAGHDPIWVETQAWLLNTKATIERLLYDSTYISSTLPSAPLDKSIKRTIMVVDDNESLRKFTAMLLEKQGFEVVQKEDGQQALDTLEKENIDLILMDIEMPIVDGVEASRRIRNSEKPYATVPIIAHTGDSSPVTLDKIGSSGMSDFIVKPADKNRLFDKIANWI
ncbi:hybrid sensor histidine kinase/response regulator [Vibrio parahaemolyticus]|uniref:ATP-binding response regulator n=1 Tax=Vibrio parahaemolyticus TaxID=670 RepID=UPI0002A59089|nr:hybrid sensor histidine kinase/response regulator [Vibrio parahaemolyticus]AGB12028.1 Sensor histidine kinase CqsS [Vibrio parahaemolyticus BB22OP]EGR0435183.1 hybrid sensor histidine kinase/response regulator [Vibrio parahaemolyticus]EGR0766587.1 hybrid sensor histidine kinase/response regulator [Vibrio parahaemolyticus]EGR2563938.1 hybrid sensor histidine kinase/response regulator [Vibrio parahaemolyticus]EGR3325980.1 hybrid sensor histidine kinase/response regulator [Vibrio parahaemolyti